MTACAGQYVGAAVLGSYAGGFDGGTHSNAVFTATLICGASIRLTRHRTGGSCMIDVTQRRAADRWFLTRGLPAVLRPGALLRRLLPRSAPALAGLAVFMANSAL